MIADLAPNRRLRPQQRAFVAHYLTCWNATEAAKRAGYKKRGDAVGHYILSLGAVQLALEAHFRDLEATNHETLVDLNRMARGAMQFFFDPAIDDFNFTSDKAMANLDLIKSITIEKNERLDKEGNVIGVTTKKRLEVTDKLAARTVLAKVQGLLSNVESQNSVTNNTLVIASPEQARDTGLDSQQVAIELQRLLAQWQGNGLGGGDESNPTILLSDTVDSISQNTGIVQGDNPSVISDARKDNPQEVLYDDPTLI